MRWVAYRLISVQSLLLRALVLIMLGWRRRIVGPWKPCSPRSKSTSSFRPRCVVFRYCKFDVNHLARHWLWASTCVSLFCAKSLFSLTMFVAAHTVIILGTKQWNGVSFVEYSDLDVMQMIGRAVRYLDLCFLPQYMSHSSLSSALWDAGTSSIW